MVLSTMVERLLELARVYRASLCLVMSLFGLLFLTACAPNTSHIDALANLSPLVFDTNVITVDDVAALVPTPDLLAVDDDMQAFVETYTGELYNDRQRMNHLHQSITSSAILNILYASDAEGAAADVFHRGTANCLSYANLFVALAREAGLDANYQWVKVRPQWSRVGERIAVRLHVNVIITMRHGQEYIVDIDPLPPSETTGTHVLSDIDALALYHNNIAMGALARNEIDQAWIHAVRALQLSPKMSLLWVNMGAIYRIAGQHEDAQSSYFTALALNSRDRSAMNNLVVLYNLDGNEEQAKYWSDQVARYRTNNPWYHAWLGDKAGEAGDWSQALMHYSDARRHDPKDSRLQYALGLIHYQLGDLTEARRFVAMAIETASTAGNLRRSELEGYQIQLNAIMKEQLAALD
ncbi:MAG: Flp pilus assembly protein TadD [Halioglobus sp.]|jgi:Flp pilus assembly protein TadD